MKERKFRLFQLAMNHFETARGDNVSPAMAMGLCLTANTILECIADENDKICGRKAEDWNAEKTDARLIAKHLLWQAEIKALAETK